MPFDTAFESYEVKRKKGEGTDWFELIKSRSSYV